VLFWLLFNYANKMGKTSCISGPLPTFSHEHLKRPFLSMMCNVFIMMKLIVLYAIAIKSTSTFHMTKLKGKKPKNQSKSKVYSNVVCLPRKFQIKIFSTSSSSTRNDEMRFFNLFACSLVYLSMDLLRIVDNTRNRWIWSCWKTNSKELDFGLVF